MSDKLSGKAALKYWRATTVNVMDNMTNYEEELVDVLGRYILRCWEARAKKGPAGPEKTMELIFDCDAEKAAAAIAAAVELIHSLGVNGELPRKYAELVKVKA
jgi:hypothetical protein